MIGAKNRYMELRWDLLLERAVASGNLTMALRHSEGSPPHRAHTMDSAQLASAGIMAMAMCAVIGPCGSASSAGHSTFPTPAAAWAAEAAGVVDLDAGDQSTGMIGRTTTGENCKMAHLVLSSG
jgi:hypothetical protein